MVSKIVALALELRTDSLTELKEKAVDVRRRQMTDAETSTISNDFLAFALAIEATRQVLGLQLYETQIVAGLHLSHGRVVEMKTGEGKTLASILPLVAASLRGRSTHVATVNDYLAKRDFQLISRVLAALGITTGLSQSSDSASKKSSAYRCNVTFATGYELGFDYLRDQVAARTSQSGRLGSELRRSLRRESETSKIQPEHDFIIIDEIDSVLLDEATTPLVISSGSMTADKFSVAYHQASDICRNLVNKRDFEIDAKQNLVRLTDYGYKKIYDQLSTSDSMNGLPLLRPWSEYITTALRAEHLLNRMEDYVVDEDKIKIVDHNTGRIFSDRSWKDGLHQAVEAKEKVAVTLERNSIASISRQRFFRQYKTLAGMTGTALGNESEFLQNYGAAVTEIPCRVPCQRIQLPTLYFANKDSKARAIARSVDEARSAGRPVLVGTRTIEESMFVSEKLAAKKIAHEILNGLQNREEAELVALAGTSGRVTVATNMAGRGTDIQLDDLSKKSGGLCVIGCSRNFSRRIDRQLAGRAARQGDPGSAQFFVSADDELLVKYGKRIIPRLFRATSRRDGLACPAFDKEIQRVQRQAERDAKLKRDEVSRVASLQSQLRTSVA